MDANQSPQLTRREREIMDVIFRLGEASVSEIMEHLPDAPTSGAIRRPFRWQVPAASVATTDIMTSPVNAALANGMFGHADETDDFHPFTKAHPGCVVLPAAMSGR